MNKFIEKWITFLQELIQDKVVVLTAFDIV